MPKAAVGRSASTGRLRRGSGGGMRARGRWKATREALAVARTRQPASREGQAGPGRVAERSVVPAKPGNSGGGYVPFAVMWRKIRKPLGYKGRGAILRHITGGARLIMVGCFLLPKEIRKCSNNSSNSPARSSGTLPPRSRAPAFATYLTAPGRVPLGPLSSALRPTKSRWSGSWTWEKTAPSPSSGSRPLPAAGPPSLPDAAPGTMVPPAARSWRTRSAGYVSRAVWSGRRRRSLRARRLPRLLPAVRLRRRPRRRPSRPRPAPPASRHALPAPPPRQGLERPAPQPRSPLGPLPTRPRLPQLDHPGPHRGTATVTMRSAVPGKASSYPLSTSGGGSGP